MKKAVWFSLFLCASMASYANEWLDLYYAKIQEWQIPDWIVGRIEKDFECVTAVTKTNLQDTINIKKSRPWFPIGRFQLINGKWSPELKGPKGSAFAAILTNAQKKYGVLPYIDCILLPWDGAKAFDGGHTLGNRAPIFCWAKSDSLKGFVLLDDNTSGMQSLVPTIIPWEERIEQLFWRGAASDGLDEGGVDWYTVTNWKSWPRAKLTLLSLRYPELIDARFTGLYCIDSHNMHAQLLKLMPMGSWATQAMHLQYKYQIVMDGNICTYPGFQWRLANACCIFKPESIQKQWFYDGLEPYEHYIPVASDLSDLPKKILWAKQHDALCKEIAQNAYEFTQQFLNPDMNEKYVYLVMLRYASLQRF